MRETGHTPSLKNSVRQQYERFPYPPIPVLALPKRGQGEGLRFELGCQLAGNSAPSRSHAGIRILVAGAGTLEPLVVAQVHPLAREIVAVDLSQASLDRLKLRLSLAKLTRFPLKTPPIRLVQADLMEWLKKAQPFDYIIASNVIHHVQEPFQLLRLLSENLSQGGMIRLVTYPKASRIWMRQTGQWLRLHGLTPTTPHLVSKAQKVIETLRLDHPIRACFSTHPEARTATGLVDAFLNACENPLNPLEWEAAFQDLSLHWIGETQTDTSRSGFLNEIVPGLSGLTPGSKLQILDDLLEICANPVLWLKKGSYGAQNTVSPLSSPRIKIRAPENRESFSSLNSGLFLNPGPEGIQTALPSPLFWELKQGLLRIEKLLEDTQVPLPLLIDRFRTEVGPRFDPKNENRPLKGLALSDYPLESILSASPPCSVQVWKEIEHRHGPSVQLRCPDNPGEIPEETLAKQAEWIQLSQGPFQPLIPVELVPFCL